MKSILTVLFVAVALYLSSCTTTSNNNTIVITKADSVTNGGTLQVSFNGEAFTLNNLTVLNSPVYTSTASLLPTNVTDTLWIGEFQWTDHKDKTISINLTAYNNTSGAAIGTYLVTTNSSTLTDYSQGQNRVYAISTGSTITVTGIIADTLEGTFAFNLYYNNNNYPATGSFKIPQ